MAEKFVFDGIHLPTVEPYEQYKILDTYAKPFHYGSSKYSVNVMDTAGAQIFEGAREQWFDD